MSDDEDEAAFQSLSDVLVTAYERGYGSGVVSSFRDMFVALKQVSRQAPAPCIHWRTVVRQRVFANNSVHFAAQCLRCGERVGDWLADVPLDTPDWDHGLKQRYRAEIKRNGLDQHNDRWWELYGEYLRSDHWRAKRELIFERSGRRCEGCGINTATQVHHVTYEHVGDEFLFELVAICADCHQRIHPD